MQENKKFVLVVDHASPSLISLAEHLGDSITSVQVLTARHQSGALQLAKQYQPQIAVMVSSMVKAEGWSLVDLIKEVSPKTRIIIVEDRDHNLAGK